MPAFTFVLAQKLRDTDIVLGSCQDLRRERPDWLVCRELTLAGACCTEYADEVLVVSHRWETPTQPDVKGTQLKAIREHLLQNPSINLVWYDFWCLPQGERTDAETTEFSAALPQINLLFLGCRVLLLVDLSYISRFWTQFEAWLSLQLVTTDGLSGSAGSPRCSIRCIHNAPASFAQTLRDLWASKSAAEAKSVLSEPDVTVTNQRDKDVQLARLDALDAEILSTVSEQRLSERLDAMALDAARSQEANAALARKRISPSWPFNMLRVRSCTEENSFSSVHSDDVIAIIPREAFTSVTLWIDEKRSSAQFWRLAPTSLTQMWEAGWCVTATDAPPSEGFVVKAYMQEGVKGMHATLEDVAS